VAHFGGIVTYFCIFHTIPLSFFTSQGKEKNKERKNKKQKKNSSNVVNKLIGMGLRDRDCIFPPLRLLWGL